MPHRNPASRTTHRALRRRGGLPLRRLPGPSTLSLPVTRGQMLVSIRRRGTVHLTTWHLIRYTILHRKQMGYSKSEEIAMSRQQTEGYSSATTAKARSAPEVVVGSSTAGTGVSSCSWKRGVRLRHAGIVIMIGLLLTACGSSSPGSSSNTRSVPTTFTTSSTGALDTCLVGTWIDRGESDTLSYKGTPLIMDGLAGKTVTFSPSGTEVVSFARATPLQGSVGGSIYTVTERGIISATVGSSAKILSFSNIDYTDFTETATLGGTATSPPEPPPPTPDRYTCSSTTMSLSGVGSHSTFRRSSALAPSVATTTSSSTTKPVPVASS